MQSNNNRMPGPAEGQAGHRTDQGAFDPGESFAGAASQGSQSSELPSWLQDFAGVAGDSSDAANTDQTTRAAGSHDSVGESAQPDEPAAPAPRASTGAVLDGFDQVPGGDTGGLLSEDDLPEWLRALSTDSTPTATETRTPSMSLAVSASVAGAANAGAIQVPAVSRAWVTASDQHETSPGATLLSSLVTVIDSRPEAVGAQPAPAVASPKPAAAVAAQPQPRAATAVEAPASESGKWSRTRILAVTAVILLLLLVIFMVGGN